MCVCVCDDSWTAIRVWWLCALRGGGVGDDCVCVCMMTAGGAVCSGGW